MYTRGYKLAVSVPPLLWVTLFLLVPYAMLFCYSFWAVAPGGAAIVHRWNLGNYGELLHNPMYLGVLFRSMRIAGTVTLLALVLGYPLAYYLSFRAARRKDLFYQLVIIHCCWQSGSCITKSLLRNNDMPEIPCNIIT